MKRELAQFPITPYWCIESAYANMMAQQIEQQWPLIQQHMERSHLQAADVAQKIEAARSSRSAWGSMDEPRYDKVRGVAIVEISGPMTRKPSCASWLYGGTSTEAVAADLTAATDDPSVLVTLLKITSPGGEVAGVSDLGDLVHALNQKKPIYAYIEDQGCSAAYWIASQCTAIYANSTAIVGSFGTVFVLRDSSRQAENSGVKYHVFSNSEHKGAGTPGTPITEAQKKEFQRLSNQLTAEFVSAVARGRNMPTAEVQALADGRVHVGKAAVDEHFIDGIQSFDDTLAQLEQKYPTAGIPFPTGGNNWPGSGTTSKEMKPMRVQFAAALAALGMHGFAARILGASDDNPATVASATSEGIKAEVAAQLATNPLLVAAKAAGVETPEAFSSLHQRAGYGDTYVSALRDEAKKQAVVAFGVTSPEGKAAVDAAHAFIASAGTPEVLKATTAQYTAVAEAKSLQQPGGAAGQRLTKPGATLTPEQDAAQANGAPAAPTIDMAAIYANRAKS